MKKIIVANWKMNPSSLEEAKNLFNEVKKALLRTRLGKGKGLKDVEVVVCPPFVFLQSLKGLTLGAQNVFYKEAGAYTGEISPAMLKDLNVKYVIVGHSESREHLHETNEIINKKLKECLKENLKPILCIGEKEGQDKLELLKGQLTRALEGLSTKDVKDTIIAYEPIWAIGTRNNCSVEETTSSILLIRKIISELYTMELAKEIKVLYGGSVTSQNSNSYITEAGANGLLVGGASLDAEEFVGIVQSTQ